MTPSQANPLPSTLGWLADAPLFIDADQVSRFYDAVVRPEGKTDKTILEVTSEKAGEIAAKLGLEVSLAPSDLMEKLTSLLPFLKVEGKALGEVQGDLSGRSGRTETIEFHTIETPQRQ